MIWVGTSGLSFNPEVRLPRAPEVAETPALQPGRAQG